MEIKLAGGPHAGPAPDLNVIPAARQEILPIVSCDPKAAETGLNSFTILI
jgi:hypothetical protein